MPKVAIDPICAKKVIQGEMTTFSIFYLFCYLVNIFMSIMTGLYVPSHLFYIAFLSFIFI